MRVSVAHEGRRGWGAQHAPFAMALLALGALGTSRTPATPPRATSPSTRTGTARAAGLSAGLRPRLREAWSQAHRRDTACPHAHDGSAHGSHSRPTPPRQSREVSNGGQIGPGGSCRSPHSLGGVKVVDDVSLPHRAGRVARAARAQRLRHDHAPADHQRLRNAERWLSMTSAGLSQLDRPNSTRRRASGPGRSTRSGASRCRELAGDPRRSFPRLHGLGRRVSLSLGSPETDVQPIRMWAMLVPVPAPLTVEVSLTARPPALLAGSERSPLPCRARIPET